MQNNGTTPEVVVVTGTSAGIGRATAVAFGKRGTCVGLLARGHAGLEGAKREICCHTTKEELFIGLATVIAIQGNKIAPAFADRYPGRTGYKSQQTGQKANPHQPDNLHGPVDEDRDYGAHGTFDNKASYTSKQLWLDMHAGALALARLGLASAATVAALARRLR